MEGRKGRNGRPAAERLATLVGGRPPPWPTPPVRRGWWTHCGVYLSMLATGNSVSLSGAVELHVLARLEELMQSQVAIFLL